MLPDTDALHEAYKRSKLKRQGITFHQAMTSDTFSKLLIRIAENAAKTAAPGKPAPSQLDRYGERNGE